MRRSGEAGPLDSGRHGAATAPTRPLTGREQEVVALVAQGHTNRQIAHKLFISERTAEYHVDQIRNKLGVRTRSQIAAWSVEQQMAPANGASSRAAALPMPRPRALPRLRLAMVALVIAVVAGGGGLALLSALQRSAAPMAMPPARVLQINVATGQLTARSVPMAAHASDLAIGEGAIWTLSYGAKILTRIDPQTMVVVGSYGVPAPPVGITVGGGFLWIATAFGDKSLLSFDPKTNHPGQPVSLPGHVSLQGIVYGRDAVWVTDKNNDCVYRVDPSTNLVSARVIVGAGPEAIAADATAVWVANAVAGTVTRIDPNSSKVLATIALRGAPTAIATGPDAVWVASESANMVIRIDPRTNAHLEIPIDGSPTGIAVAGSSVWIAEGTAGRIARIDPARNSIVSSISVGGRVDGIAVDDQSVWVTVHGG